MSTRGHKSGEIESMRRRYLRPHIMIGNFYDESQLQSPLDAIFKLKCAKNIWNDFNWHKHKHQDHCNYKNIFVVRSL